MPKAGVRVYAHRGASRELPENTMAAFRRALELGADALETDLHATADGVLVTSHDPDGARVFGVARRIADCRWSEVREWGVPSLEEVVRAFPGVPINVDLKVDVAALAVETLRRLDAEEQVTLASFQSATLRRARALGYRGPTSLGRSEVARLVTLPAAAQRGPFAPPGTLGNRPDAQSAFACSICSRELETRFHQMCRGPSIVAPPSRSTRALPCASTTTACQGRRITS